MMRKLIALAGMFAAGVALAGPANAGDSNGNIQAKIGVTGALPDNNTTSVVGLPAGTQAEVRDEVIPSLTLTYYLNKNLAVELFCCFAKIGVDIPGVGQVANAWIFPPVLTLQYHFDNVGPFKPYVGAGVEWIHYFSEKSNIGGSVDFSDSVGFALQGGVDYDLGQGWSLGVDVKKVWEDTTLTYSNGIVAEHDVDPLFVTANLGYRFNLSDLLGARNPAPMK